MAKTKEATEKAYKAGYALPGVQWPEDATAEQRTPGPHHCPFRVDQAEEREAWLNGLRDALGGEQAPDPSKIVKEIDEELKVASNAR